MAKTNAMRLLDDLGIPYQTREYEVNPADLSAETVADKIGLPAEQVFKTLVVRREKRGVCLAIVPGNTELDLKALAKLASDRKMKEYPVFVDEAAILFECISVSAGIRGTQILLSPEDYIRVIGGTVGEISKSK